MILEKQTEANILQEGTTQETVKMSLDLDSAQILMQMLSKNLYSDAIGSTIRECASNALDSHRRIKSDKPIIVSFKRNNQADTYEFAVEDFGIGLDADDVRNIISKYGKSTKRDSNTELGMMGLGFKAPLAYSSSFYFVARKNGMERKYMMYEGEDTNSIDLLYETPTSEVDGVQVIVPVNYYDRHTFTNKIKEQLAYFKNVYFKIEDLGSNYSISNDFTIHRSEHFQYSSLSTSKNMHLCLDDVSYPIDWEKLGISEIPIKLALRFNLSDGLFPTPNREAIRYTKEAKETILKKIGAVADIFVNKFNESISTENNITAIMGFYSTDVRFVTSWYKNQNDQVCINELMKSSSISINKPKLDGVKLLDLERLSQHSKAYILSEYQYKYKFDSGRFSNQKKAHYKQVTISDVKRVNADGIYIYKDEFSKAKQNYLRSLFGSTSSKKYDFIKKSPFKLMGKIGTIDYNKYYHSVLELNKHPKNQWRQLIQEFQYVVGLFSKDFIDLDAIDIPQSFIDSQKIKRLSVKTVFSTTKKVRMKDDFSGKIGTAMQVTLANQYCKFVPSIFKMELVHQVKQLHIYGKEEDKLKLDRIWSCANHAVTVIVVAQSVYNNLQTANLHNWITVDKFMEGKTRPFKTIATSLLIHDLMAKRSATFLRLETVKYLSLNLGNKLQLLHNYDCKNYLRHADMKLKTSILEYSVENKLFDESIYTIYKEIDKMFNALPFLNTLMDKMSYDAYSFRGSAMTQPIIDLFKYNKYRISLEHYKLTSTENTDEKLQTI